MSNLKYTSFGLERKVEKISDFVEAINNRLKYDQEENNRKFIALNADITSIIARLCKIESKFGE